MGFDCGFDIFPAFERTPSNQENFDLFLQDLLAFYVLGTEVIEEEASLVFPVGEHPRIPYRCEYFLRFSSKVSGNSTPPARPYIIGVYEIANRWFGDRVHYWHEMCETDDHHQWSFYDWNQIYEMDLQRKKKEDYKWQIVGAEKAGGVDISKEAESGIESQTLDETTPAGKEEWYTVHTVPGKGQGAIASSSIPKGTRILAESPIFKVPRDTTNCEFLTQLIAKDLKALDKNTQRAFFTLHNASRGQDQNPVLGIARTNALPLGSGAEEGGIFLEASRFNHSCRHNAQNTWNANLNQLTIHVLKDIEEGEELTICYFDGFKTYSERQTLLRDSFNFECTCGLCTSSPVQRQESDRRLREMAQLDELIGGGLMIINTPLACLRKAYALWQLLDQEDIDTAMLARLYYDAFQIAVAHGDQARASTFAGRAYTLRLILEGEDSPDTMKLKALMEYPHNHRLYGTSMKWRQGIGKVPEALAKRDFENWLWRK